MNCIGSTNGKAMRYKTRVGALTTRHVAPATDLLVGKRMGEPRAGQGEGQRGVGVGKLERVGGVENRTALWLGFYRASSCSHPLIPSPGPLFKKSETRLYPNYALKLTRSIAIYYTPTSTKAAIDRLGIHPL